MAKYAPKLTIFIIFAFFGLFTALTPAFGRGRQDQELIRVDQLINEREHDEALLILTDYIRRNPDNFELAQQRIQRIAAIRDEFNKTADELIYVLIQDPDNSERQLALTSKLRTLENENSELMINFVARTHEIAQFNVYRNQLRVIMERGRALLDGGDGDGAIQTYAGGMDMMREEFFTSGYGERIEGIVTRERNRINSIISSFQVSDNQMGSYSAELRTSITSNQTARILDSMNRLAPIVDNFVNLKQEMYNSVGIIDGIMGELAQAHPEMRDRNHLAFLSRLIHGRADEDIQEGMLGAFEATWRSSIGSVIEAVAADIESGYSANLAAFNARNYSNVRTSMDSIERYIDITSGFLEKHMLLNQGSELPVVTIFGKPILQDDAQAYMRIISVREASNILNQASSIAMRFSIDRSSVTDWQAGRIGMAEALNRESQTRNNINGMQRELSQTINNANQASEEINRFSNTMHIKNSLDAIAALYNNIIEEERWSAVRYYTIEYQDMERHLAARREEFQKSRVLFDGQSQTMQDGTVRTIRYPDEALAEFAGLLSAVTNNLERGNGVLGQFIGEPQTISVDAEFSRLLAGYQSFINELNSIRTQSLAMSDTARTRTAMAASYRQEAERAFGEAQTAFQRQDLDAAKTSLNRATEQLYNSLELQESSSLRNLWDTQILDLSRRIAAAENERIIAEVRNMIDTARNFYFSGDFSQAENTLVRARTRWSVANPQEENPEIINLLGMVRSNSTERASRDIPVTAPLFPVMSQLLSQAQTNYGEGIQLINAGSRNLGITKFNEAREKTREVKLVYPVNQEAGLLELRMEQFLDPQGFNASFAQRLNTARAGARQGSWEAFGELQSLAAINPNYPGIAGIIRQAEIDMGLRRPDPNPADIARARELVTSASRVLDNNTTTQFEVALTWLDEAIRLDPNNIEAVRVKDRLLIRMGQGTVTVLSSQDEEQYQRAMREFQAGNHLIALSIVDRLLQNQSYRNVTRLTDLQSRIQASLR